MDIRIFRAIFIIICQVEFTETILNMYSIKNKITAIFNDNYKIDVI